MRVLFAVDDPDGRRVVCDAAWWKEHVELHAEMVGRELWVQETIGAPMAIYASTTHPNRSIFHRQYHFGGLLRRKWLRVVVEYNRRSMTDPLPGVINYGVRGERPKGRRGAHMAELGTSNFPAAELSFPAPAQMRVRYNRERDILFVGLPSPPPAVSYDLAGEAWIRIVPETGEVVGFEIEEYERSFLTKHPEIASEWHNGRQRGVAALLRRPAASESLTRELLNLLKRSLTNQPRQLPLSSHPNVSA